LCPLLYTAYTLYGITALLDIKFNILGVRLSHAIQILGMRWGAMLKIGTTITSGDFEKKNVFL